MDSSASRKVRQDFLAHIRGAPFFAGSRLSHIDGLDEFVALLDTLP